MDIGVTVPMWVLPVCAHAASGGAAKSEAMQPDELRGEDMDASPQTAIEPMTHIAECWFSFDVLETGERREIFMLLDTQSDIPLYYEETGHVTPRGIRPFEVHRTEEVDGCIPKIMNLDPTVLIVTGDHSTPSKMKSHSWHPVPTMIAADLCRYDGSTAFGEKECRVGGLGQFEAKYLMPMALAHAGRLEKFGA